MICGKPVLFRAFVVIGSIDDKDQLTSVQFPQEACILTEAPRKSVLSSIPMLVGNAIDHVDNG